MWVENAPIAATARPVTARELLQSRCDFDTLGLQVPTSVSVMCIWEIPVKCGTKELNIERRLMIF